MKSLVEKAENAHALVKQLIEVQETSRRLDVTKGKLLWQLKSDNLFKKAFGSGVDTWEEFLRSPELHLTVSEANRAMQLYEYFVLKFEIEEDTLSQVPVKSLHHLLPRLKSGEVRAKDVPELVGAAQSLTFNEFKERLFDIQHDEAVLRTYTYSVMRRCKETGNLSRVQDITSDQILAAFPGIEHA